MKKLQELLEAYRNGTSEFPTYEQLAAIANGEQAMIQECKRLKDILRTDPQQLEIRLSYGDLHAKRVITEHEIVSITSPVDMVGWCAMLMWRDITTIKADS